jgi:Tetratricopeptide repeat
MTMRFGLQVYRQIGARIHSRDRSMRSCPATVSARRPPTRKAGTLIARTSLASSYLQARRTADAIAIFERVGADTERILGPGHPDAVAALTALARWKQASGR